MKWSPRAEQQDVLDFIEPKERGAIFAPTGGGKTALAATWADLWMNDRCAVPRLLIVAPKLVALEGWPAQLQRWDHLRHMARDVRVLEAADFGLTAADTIVNRVTRTTKRVPRAQAVDSAVFEVARSSHTFADKRATKKHLQSLRQRVHVVSWDFFPWLAQAYGSNFPYQGVIFDESSFLRDQQSARGTAARHVVHRTGVVSHVLELAALPNINHNPTIFPQIDLLAPGVLGANLTHFRETWCQPDTINRHTGVVYSWKIVPALLPELTEIVSRYAVSVPSSLAVPLLEVDQGVDLGEASRAAYDAMDRTSVWRTVTAGSAGVQHGKLRQMASGFAYDDDGKTLFLHNSKLERMEEMAEAEGQVLVAFEFEEELKRLRKTFGKHFKDIRESGAKSAFENGALKFLGVHPLSAGHGVDGLQHACNQVWWATVPQDRELYDQLNGRVHRHGTNSQSVYTHRFFARGTREEQIKDEVLPGRKAASDLFLEGLRI